MTTADNRAPWAIAADAACAAEGHPKYIDGRCIRCRQYEPAKPSTPHILSPISNEERELETHLARMNRMMDSGDSVY